MFVLLLDAEVQSGLSWTERLSVVQLQQQKHHFSAVIWGICGPAFVRSLYFIILCHPQSPRRSTPLHCSVKSHMSSPMLERVLWLTRLAHSAQLVFLSRRHDKTWQVCVSATTFLWLSELNSHLLLSNQDFTCCNWL